MIKSKVIGTGSYLPEKIVTNEDLVKSVDTSDEWIRTRTGITRRHIAKEGEFTSHMASKAAKNALENAGITIKDTNQSMSIHGKGTLGSQLIDGDNWIQINCK